MVQKEKGRKQGRKPAFLRMVLSGLLAAALVLTAVPAAAFSSSAAASAITYGEVLNPPATAKWINKDEMVFGFSPVEGANVYIFQYFINGERAEWCSVNYANSKPESDGLFHVNARNRMILTEGSQRKEYNGVLTVRIWAGKGKIGNSFDISSASYASPEGSVQYTSYLSQLEPTQVPQNVSLSVDEFGNYTVSCDKVTGTETYTDWDNPSEGNVAEGQNAVTTPQPVTRTRNVDAYEYGIQFIINGDPNGYSFYSYNSSTQSVSSLVFTEDSGKIIIPISDEIKSRLEQYAGKNQIKTISVKMCAQVSAWQTLDDGTRISKYQRSDWSPAAGPVNYTYISDVTRPVVTVSSLDQPQTIPIQSSEAVNVLSDADKQEVGNNPTLQLQLKKPESSDELNNLDSEIKGKNYTDSYAFELDLVAVAGNTSKGIKNTKVSLKITVPVPVSMRKPGRTFIIFRNHDGKIEPIGSGTGDSVTFYTNKFSLYSIAYKEEDDVEVPSDNNSHSSSGGQSYSGSNSGSSSSTSSPLKPEVKKFTDVTNTSAWYYNAVNWASEKGIASGYTNGSFGVNDSVRRDQFVVFLWRLAGKPETKTASEFTDISSESTSFQKAINWAASKGLILGIGENLFDPKETLTREQAAAILYRYYKGTGTDKTDVFTDVDSGSWYADAVNWGASQGIILGIGNSKFGTGQATTRGQAVQLLYKAEHR